MHYLVAELDAGVVGFCLVVFALPPDWPPEDLAMPRLIDLYIIPAQRGRGAGTALLAAAEARVAAAGGRSLHLGVDPLTNPRAHALYLRCGYQPMQERPYHARWRFRDHSGQVREAEGWNLDLRKRLPAGDAKER